MLGPPAGELSQVRVRGSLSGAHAGHLAAYRSKIGQQGNGASFVPDKPFTQGERVSVHAELRDGTTTTPFAWSFMAAVQDHGGVAGGSPRPAPQKATYQLSLAPGPQTADGDGRHAHRRRDAWRRVHRAVLRARAVRADDPRRRRLAGLVRSAVADGHARG
jgi:hypothetical protein